jgi:predicted dehydrogenase
VKSVYVDKPIAIDSKQLGQLGQILPKLNKPVFFGDHYVYAATGLLALLGKETIHKALLDLRFDTMGDLRAALDQAQPLLGRLAKVEARTTFIGSQSLVGDRGWLEKSSLGGGVLLDLAVHQTNVLHCLGLEVEKVERADRRIRPDEPSTPLGVFVPRPAGSDLAEDYADVSGRLRGGAVFSLTVAQFEKEYQDFLILTDENGRSVKMDYVTRTVRVFQGEELIGELRCAADPVLLTMHHALSYFASGDTEPMYYQEHRNSVELIERIKAASDQDKSVPSVLLASTTPALQAHGTITEPQPNQSAR